ncbi:chemotaxis protein CheA [bacterium]|nr:chemotaxis protein CheA [bacterium]
MSGARVIAEAALADRVRASAGTDDALAKQLGTLDAVSRRLQESATALRMIPLTSAFRRLQRLARDVSTKSGKRIECVITGEDTELDKAVVDAIVDPLMHLVRNAVDHGIEDDPVVRECAGKPAAGTVRIHAEQVGSGIHITVSDDGRGFDPAAISRVAAERGLLVPDDAGDAELLELVFAPGFSTAEQVTEISGRGVGLDVVRRTVQSLRGTIDVTSSPGVGTEFRVTLPLTLAIIDAMVVRVAEERYVIPTLSVVRSVRPSAGDITGVLGRAEVLHAEGRFLPLVRLDRLFGIKDAEQDPERAVCVIVRDGERAAALMVCELTGQQQTVIKPLGEGIGRAPGISGGAVMADGGVGLIVDVAGIVRLAAAEGSERR